LASLLYIFLKYLPEKRKEEEWAKAVQDYYDAKLISYGEENAKYAPYEVDVAFIGDSLTDGYDLNTYYPDLLTVNRGIGGDTTFGVEKRLKVSLYDLQPKVVVMLIGANNFKTMFENYENILIGLRDNLPNSEIVILSLTSMGHNWGKNNQLAAFNNVKIKALAEKYGYEYVDLYTPLLNMETNEIYEHYTTDGGHLTPAGYEVLTARITPTLKKLLENYPASQ
jgi:lysophospholipase L1-like esterase